MYLTFMDNILDNIAKYQVCRCRCIDVLQSEGYTDGSIVVKRV